MHSASFTTRFHTSRNIDRVTPHVESSTGIARDHRPGVYPNPDRPFRLAECSVLYIASLNELHQVKRRRACIPNVCRAPFRYPADTHVGITDGFHLLETVFCRDLIKTLKESIQGVE